MRRISLILTAFGLVLLALSVAPRVPRLLYNPSPSAPVGWYVVKPKPSYEAGDLVAVRLPQKAANLAIRRGYLPENVPIIKIIAAGPGGLFCVREKTLSVQPDWQVPILSIDGQMREMPVLPDGCEGLNAGEYLVLSDRVSHSFDSRYFGPVSERDILGIAVKVGETDQRELTGSVGFGWARAKGAQGKIKESGAVLPLTPCLHINFYGAVRQSAALLILEISNIHYRMEPRYRLIVGLCCGRLAR